jgi:cytoskeletal protein RodZ
MENSNNKSLVWGVVIVVLVIVLGVWFYKSHSDTKTAPTEDTVAIEPESTQDVDAKSPSTASIKYADALVKYADRRIQLDPACQAHPNTVTYKDNTGIMIDNRSAMTRTVKVGTTVTIKPYGFKIIVLPDIYLKSKTLLVDCDKSQNVATVLVQE